MRRRNHASHLGVRVRDSDGSEPLSTWDEKGLTRMMMLLGVELMLVLVEVLLLLLRRRRMSGVEVGGRRVLRLMLELGRRVRSLS